MTYTIKIMTKCNQNKDLLPRSHLSSTQRIESSSCEQKPTLISAFFALEVTQRNKMENVIRLKPKSLIKQEHLLYLQLFQTALQACNPWPNTSKSTMRKSAFLSYSVIQNSKVMLNAKSYCAYFQTSWTFSFFRILIFRREILKNFENEISFCTLANTRYLKTSSLQQYTCSFYRSI